MVSFRKKENFDPQERAISDVILKELESFESLAETEKAKKNEEIVSLMKYYNELSQQIENRRISIYNSTLQTVVICLTAIGLLVAQRANIPTLLFRFSIFVLVTQFIFSLVTLAIYQFQSYYKDYPFFKVKYCGKNTWKWFYYGNEYIQRINRNPVFPSEDFKLTIEPYLEGLKKFISEYKCENLNKEIIGNIQQLYIVQVHNYYKNKFYLQLTVTRLIPLLIIAVTIVVYFILYIYNIVVTSSFILI